MGVSTPFARSYLRNAWVEAQAAGQTLLAKLNAINATTIATVGNGKTISATSGNGRSVSFAAPLSTSKAPSEGVTPTDMAEMLDRLFSLYDAAVAAGNATDATRYTYMLTNLRAVRAVRKDYRLLRSSKLDLFPIYPFFR